MHLTAVHIQDFRNIGDARLEPAEGVNVIEGDNGQGKTNLLEAVYVLSTLRSFRSNRREELVRWGERSLLLEAEVERRDVRRTFRVEISSRGSTFSIKVGAI